jgi:hypothetical protein
LFLPFAARRGGTEGVKITSGVTRWTAAATQGGRPNVNLSSNSDFHIPFNKPAIVATALIQTTPDINGSRLFSHIQMNDDPPEYCYPELQTAE